MNAQNSTRQRLPACFRRRPNTPTRSGLEILERTARRIPLPSMLTAETDDGGEWAQAETWDGYPSRDRGDTR